MVVVWIHLQIKDQGVAGGGTIDRDNHSVHVLAKQPDRSWLIVSELYMDARSEKTYLEQ